MALTARIARITEAEFLALPESKEKVELIDGEVVISPSATYRHQMFSARIVDRLRAWVRENATSHVVLYAPLDIRLGPGRIVQPDIVVFERPLPLDVAMPIDTRPLLCVEIVSSNRIYDRVTKRMLYAAAGIPEFWCVEQTGEVERFSGENLSSADRYDDRLTTPLFPGFDLDLRTLLAP